MQRSTKVKGMIPVQPGPEKFVDRIAVYPVNLVI
jgi:hypothetical protein